jgi:hypothetical protein
MPGLRPVTCTPGLPHLVARCQTPIAPLARRLTRRPTRHLPVPHRRFPPPPKSARRRAKRSAYAGGPSGCTPSIFGIESPSSATRLAVSAVLRASSPWISHTPTFAPRERRETAPKRRCRLPRRSPWVSTGSGRFRSHCCSMRPVWRPARHGLGRSAGPAAIIRLIGTTKSTWPPIARRASTPDAPVGRAIRDVIGK